MADTREPQAVVHAAEQAAAAGDYASAEQLLREAASLQEATLGPLHPDLANTLNNLGVVCEITDKPDDAEDCFRRAWTIATAALPPDHPFVATSRRNLEDFCAARGRLADPPAPPPPPEHALPPERSLPPERAPAAVSQPNTSRRGPGPFAIGAAIVAILTLVAIATWLLSGGEMESPRERATASPPVPETTGSAPASSASSDSRAEIGTESHPLSGEDSETGATASTMQTDGPGEDRLSRPTAAAGSQETAASGSRQPLVVTAQLCRSLSTSGGDWQCVPTGSPVGPGSLVFYTRIKSPTGTTVQHRWYRGERLRQAVELSVRANPSRGYRTYSRATVDNQGGGDWRIELRASDGTLLHEERFIVR